MTHDPIQTHSPKTVAVIGAGPAGLTAAAWLIRHGFEPVLFEAAARPGGQWNTASPMSGVWRSMHTNTSRVMSAFSDLDHAPSTPVYPSQEQMLAYLDRYAEATGVAGRVRASTQVLLLDRAADGSGWLVRSRTGGAAARTERFARVVVATGRQTAPSTPPVPGLETFAGTAGAIHSAQYDGAAPYRGLDVLVAGGAISAVEIAAELAQGGARSVTVASRRQRYVIQKMVAGVPAEHLLFNRFSALAGEAFPPEANAAALRDLIVRTSGRPEQFGAPPAHDDVRVAGVTQSQGYLALVAEGRIRPRPWIRAIDGRAVTFEDGTVAPFDALIMASGYRLSLPFLSPAIAGVLACDGLHTDLVDHTLHPDLPGLAFLGLYDLVGPFLPTVELQARWIAGLWSGQTPALSAAAWREGMSRVRARRAGPASAPMHELALCFARRAGVEPDLDRWPRLRRALLFGPLSPASFRLQGPHAAKDAPRRTAEAAAAFGLVPDPQMSAEQAGQWRALRRALPKASRAVRTPLAILSRLSL